MSFDRVAADVACAHRPGSRRRRRRLGVVVAARPPARRHQRLDGVQRVGYGRVEVGHQQAAGGVVALVLRLRPARHHRARAARRLLAPGFRPCRPRRRRRRPCGRRRSNHQQAGLHRLPLTQPVSVDLLQLSQPGAGLDRVEVVEEVDVDVVAVRAAAAAAGGLPGMWRGGGSGGHLAVTGAQCLRRRPQSIRRLRRHSATHTIHALAYHTSAATAAAAAARLVLQPSVPRGVASRQRLVGRLVTLLLVLLFFLLLPEITVC